MMAKKPVSQFELDALYRVRLARPAEWRGHKLPTQTDLKLKGKVCAEIADRILSAERIGAEDA